MKSEFLLKEVSTLSKEPSKTHTVLVVDDEPQIQTFIRISLLAEGFDYIGASSIGQALALFDKHQPHIVILDLGLPDGDGIGFLETIRSHSKVPVLILTARDEEEEKIRLLQAGANDYLSKPFGIRELIVRIKVLVRDLIQINSEEDVILCGSLKLQLSAHQVWLNDKVVALTKKEFAFLHILAQHQSKLVKQEYLLDAIWGTSHRQDSHYLRILVSQLRKKLGDGTDNQPLIKTEAGLGYRIIVGDINLD